ncbi:MAG: Unknown protein [uncultured Sulfurovum sp.]|uniref:Thioredoxin domain-containing protein n=1 Tax=uncultured Sulfurovum sp. TaxID=269237 RepID=A0A6S6S7I8_9BACT|nr:MAG: Unknown protein [uncultured Sulfurovum sp.]
MNKLTFLGFLFLISFSALWAEEYISNEYYEEIISQTEVVSDVNESIITLDESNESTESVTTEKIIDEENTTVAPAIVSDVSEDETVENDTTQKEIDEPEVNEKEVSEKFSPYLSALKEAKENGKTILLAIRATDCHYCDRMETETLSDSSVKNALEKDFVTLHYNQDLEPLPLEIQEGMTPNFIFVDKNENIINMYPGMRTPSEFKEALAEILSQ